MSGSSGHDGVRRLLSRLHRRERDVLRRVGEAHDHPDVLLREKPLRRDDVEPHRARDREQRDAEHEPAMTKHPFQRALVASHDPVEHVLGGPERPAVLPLVVLQQTRRHHRRERQRDHGRDGDGDAERHRELAEETPDDPAHEQNRNEHGEERHRDRDDRESDLTSPFDGGVERLHPLLDEARDVLGDDDGVVDDEPRRDRERHERQVVEAVAEQIHDAERADERERHGDGGNDGRAHGTQEHEDDEHDEHDADDERDLDVVDGGADALGPIERDARLDGGRDRRSELGQQGLDAIVRLDDVRAGLAPDDDEHRASAVDPRRDPLVLDRVDDGGDVFEAHDGAVVALDDQLLVVRRAEDLIVGGDEARARRPADRALRRVGRRRREGVADVVEGEPHASERLRIGLHAHGGLLPSADRHLPDPFDLRDALGEDRDGGVGDVAARDRLAREREDQRIGASAGFTLR